MVPLSEPPEPPDPAPLSSRQPAMVDISKGYSSVNKFSLLPAEMRTATNLEGGTVPTDQESLLLEKYRKERADYELKQLQKMAELKAKREGGAAPNGGTGYEDIDPSPGGVHRPPGEQKARGGVDPYEFPADAVPHTPGKVGGAKRSPKKLSVGKGVSDLGEDYTPVFNTLPKGRTEKFPPGKGRTTRALSDSSPTAKVATGSYENTSSPWPSPSKASPEEVGVARSNEAGVGGRLDSNRQSKRKLAKEVVEFNPDKPKKFRMMSDVKKSDSKSAEVNNQTDGGVAGEAMPTRPFSVHADEPGQLSYALVSMEDKKRYRLETNTAKMEGSGPPQHYRVPIASS